MAAIRKDGWDVPFQQAWGAPYPAPDQTTDLPDPRLAAPVAESVGDWRRQDGGVGTIARMRAALAARWSKAPALAKRLQAIRVKLGKAAAAGNTEMVYAGIPVTIDRPKGFVQTGTAHDGSPWTRIYRYDYGFLAGTEGGEGVDVYVGPDPAAAVSYWAVQLSHDGTFDEFKVFMGFPSLRRAHLAYVLHAPPRLLAAILPVPLAAVRALLGIDPRHPGIEKAGDEGPEAGARVGEGARGLAERIGEFGEGHGKQPEGHKPAGQKKPAGEKKPAAAAKPSGGGEKKPSAKKPAAKPAAHGGGGPERDENGRFAPK